MDRYIRLAEAKMQLASTLSHTEWHPCALPSRPPIPLGLSWLMIWMVRKERTNLSIARSSLSVQAEMQLNITKNIATIASRISSLSGLVLAILSLSALSASAQVEYVDPTIGNVGILLEPTRPTVYLPNSMVRVYPVRADALDDRIDSFPLTISSHRIDELFSIMPGEARQPSRLRSGKDYAVLLFHPLRRVADPDRVLADRALRILPFYLSPRQCLRRVVQSTAGNLQTQKDGVVSGEEQFSDMKAFVYGEFSAPVTFNIESKGDRKQRQLPQRKAANGSSFATAYPSSASNRRKRICGERFRRGELITSRKLQRRDGTKLLAEIAVEGGTEAQRRVFYTALYRCFERMVNITEDGRYYSGFDHQVHQDARPFYVDNWLWDTYRALEPLQTLLNPDMEADKIQSYVRMYQQSGIMPTFALVSGNYACMNGNHSAPWFADAWFKGVRNFDLPDCLRRRSQTVSRSHACFPGAWPQRATG